MSEDMSRIFLSKMSDENEAYDLLKKLVAVADTSTVYGEAVTVGDRTLITACEVSAGAGFAFGRGGGSPQRAEGDVDVDERFGFGGGGGGGGGSTARPVAVISVGPDGVRVDPIIDQTKIALAFLTALGTMLMMRRRMARGGR